MRTNISRKRGRGVAVAAFWVTLNAVLTTMAATTTFQEGVSPSAGYAHDAVMIRSDFATSNLDGAGAIYIGLAEVNSEVIRGLFEFDVSAIPSADVIASASLTLKTLSDTAGINNVGGTGALTTFNLYTHAYDIAEGTATWNAPGGGAPPGGSLGGTLLSSVSINVEVKGQAATFPDTAAFRDAVANALAGDGVLRLIIANNDESNLGTHDFARFEDNEDASASVRPMLTVVHAASSGATLIWSGEVGVSNVSETAATAYATLGGTNAEVTLYWKQGSSAPQQHTGWDGTNSSPAGLIATGLVERAMTSLQPDTEYSFIFYATNGLAVNDEAWSSAGSVTTALSAAQSPAFTTAVAGAGSVTLGWSDNAANETGYILQRSDSGSGGPYSVIATLAPDTVSYVDSGLSVGTYHYRLAATNAANSSATAFTACQTSALVSSAPAYIYLETFSGTGALNGTAPDARPGSETWTASDWQKDGTIADQGENADSCWLPFTPQSGKVYTLEVTFDAVASGNLSGSWTAFGFGNGSDTSTFFGSPNDTAPWALYRATQTPDQIISFAGPGATGSGAHGTVSGPVTLSIVLDTTAANWTAEWFEGSNSLRTHTYTTNPTISTVGFGRSNDSDGPIDVFSLSDNSVSAATYPTLIIVK